MTDKSVDDAIDVLRSLGVKGVLVETYEFEPAGAPAFDLRFLNMSSAEAHEMLQGYVANEKAAREATKT